MPSFTFKNPKTGETREIFVRHEEIAKGYHPDKDKWERVFEPVSIRTDTCNRTGNSVTPGNPYKAP